METDKSQPSLILLFDSLPIIDPQQLAINITSLESIGTEIIIDVTIQLQKYLCASVKFESHWLRLTGFSVPISTYIRDMTVGFSDLLSADKTSLDEHKSYIICDYEGDDRSMIERLISLYKTAYGFHTQGLLGVLDLGAWSCRTSNMLIDMLSKKMLRSYRDSTEIALAIGLVKIPKGNGDIWFCTKGFHRFNSQDYAYLGTASEEEFIRGIFGGFFDIIDPIQGLEFECGDRFEFEDGSIITTRSIYEYIDYLSSPLGTFVLERKI
jgi:hypothetical protein